MVNVNWKAVGNVALIAGSALLSTIVKVRESNKMSAEVAKQVAKAVPKAVAKELGKS